MTLGPEGCEENGSGLGRCKLKGGEERSSSPAYCKLNLTCRLTSILPVRSSSSFDFDIHPNRPVQTT